MVDWKEHFYYSVDSPSGLRWVREAANRRMKIGDVAGRVDSKGYWSVGLYGKRIKTHRIIWEMFNGEIPIGFQVDHKDGNKSNFSVDNFRLVVSRQNSQNQKRRSTNSSGIVGVHVTSNGSGTLYWTASWQDVSMKKVNKRFSISSLGYEKAFALACETREKAIEELNDNGMDYSERHGK